MSRGGPIRQVRYIAVLVIWLVAVTAVSVLVPASAAAEGTAEAETLRAEEVDAAIQQTERWKAHIAAVADQFDIPPAVLQAIMSVESGGDPNASSPTSGGVGLMQVTPRVASSVQGYYGNDLANPMTNILVAAEFLKRAVETYGNWDLAAAVYAGKLSLDGTRPTDVEPRDADEYGYTLRFRYVLAKLGYIQAPASRAGNMLAFATEMVGKPYVWGAADPAVGFDCSGLVYWAYQQVGVTLPRSNDGQMAATVPITREELQPGDLVFFYGHVGIYVGNNQMLHAPNWGDTVRIDSLSDSYWAANLIGYGRLP